MSHTTCEECNGEGVIDLYLCGRFAYTALCPECDGSGEIRIAKARVEAEEDVVYRQFGAQADRARTQGRGQ